MKTVNELTEICNKIIANEDNRKEVVNRLYRQKNLEDEDFSQILYVLNLFLRKEDYKLVYSKFNGQRYISQINMNNKGRLN